MHDPFTEETLCSDIGWVLKRSGKLTLKRGNSNEGRAAWSVAMDVINHLRDRGWQISSDPLKKVEVNHYRALKADAGEALRMIREVVERHAPPRSVPTGKPLELPLIEDAEMLVKGILAIAGEKESGAS